MSTGTERRVEVRQPVTLVVEYPDCADLVSDFTENLSMGGTLVHTERPLPVGSEVRLILSCPGLIEPVLIEGTVRWVRDSEVGEAGAGIQFSGYDERTRKRLREVINGIAASDPAYIGEVISLLLVEDNRHITNLIRDGLTLGRAALGENVALHFTIARDGHEALALALASNGSAPVFDAAIVDVYLPVLDGPTLIKRLRAERHTQYLPIIAMSGGGRDAADRALEAGADRFLSKPVRLQEVIAALKGVIPKISATDAAT